MTDATSSTPAADRGYPALPEDVKQILDSRTFEKAPALRALLAYLWEQRDANLSEYAIATEALGRSPSFDARTDATVRVQVSRLRQRLERYYEKEDTACLSRLIIPLGSHQITWQQRPRSQQNEEKHALEPLSFTEQPVLPVRSTSASSRTLVLLSTLLAIISISEAVYLYRLHRERTLQTNAVASRPLPWFWRKFFGNGHGTRITLPTPLFFSFSRSQNDGRASIMFRDTEINDFEDRSLSPPFRILEKNLGSPVLAENYTVTSDTFASVRLARYCDKLGFQAEVASSADNPLEALDHQNLIGVGTWGTLGSLSPYLERMSFRLGRHETSVSLGHPEPGEPTVVSSVIESPERGIWPGVVAFLPGNSGQTHLLVLASRHTSALVSFLTSSDGLEQLKHIWEQHHSPEYFEVIVSAELSGRTVVRTWPVALHAFRNNP